jgi:hypothetical protein
MADNSRSDTRQVDGALEVVADGGKDDLDNLRAYCSACHAMVNWARAYSATSKVAPAASYGADTTAGV